MRSPGRRWEPLGNSGADRKSASKMNFWKVYGIPRCTQRDRSCEPGNARPDFSFRARSGTIPCGMGIFIPTIIFSLFFWAITLRTMKNWAMRISTAWSFFSPLAVRSHGSITAAGGRLSNCRDTRRTSSTTPSERFRWDAWPT